jgi:chromosome segregation ATPase
MEIEIRRLKEALDARSRESEEWRLKAVRYETQLNEANSRFGHTQQLEKRVGEYEIRMSGLTQNLELLDRQLKDKTSELISLSGQYREFQAEYSRREVELRQYAQRISTYEQEL